MPADKGYPWGEIRMALVSGFMTQKQISEKYDIPLGTIAAASARGKWIVHTAPEELAGPKYQRYEGTDEEHSKIVKETAQSMKDEVRDLGARVARKGLKHLAQDDVTGAAVVGLSKNVKDLVDVAAKVCGFDTPENATILSLHFLGDEIEPQRIVDAVPAALPPS